MQGKPFKTKGMMRSPTGIRYSTMFLCHPTGCSARPENRTGGDGCDSARAIGDDGGRQNQPAEQGLSYGSDGGIAVDFGVHGAAVGDAVESASKGVVPQPSIGTYGSRRSLYVSVKPMSAQLSEACWRNRGRFSGPPSLDETLCRPPRGPALCLCGRS